MVCMAFAARTAGSVRVPPAGGLYGVRCANGWLCAGFARRWFAWRSLRERLALCGFHPPGVCMAFAARTAGSVRVPPAGGLHGVRCANGWLCAGSARQASGSFSSCAAGVRVKGLASPLTIPASGSLHAALRAVPSLLTSALRTARIRHPVSCHALADVLSARPGRRARLSVSDASVTPSPVSSYFFINGYVA